MRIRIGTWWVNRRLTQRSDLAIVVEPGYQGHRYEFVARLARQLVQDERSEVRCVTSQAGAESAEFEAELGPLVADRSSVVCSVGVREQNTLYNRIADIRSLREQPPAVAIFPNVDEYLVALTAFSMLRKKVDWRGIVLRPPARDGARNRIKRCLLLWLAWRGVQLFPLVSPFDTIATPRWATDIVIDPNGLSAREEGVACSAPFKAWLSLQATRKVVVVTGAISRRKSVLELTRFAVSQEDVAVALIGMPESEAIAEEIFSIVNGNPRFFVDFRRVAIDELNGAIASATWLSLLYSNSVGSSGLLARSTALGTPVLSLRNRTVDSAIQRFSCGSVLSEASQSELRRCLDSPPPHVKVDALPDRARVAGSWGRVTAR